MAFGVVRLTRRGRYLLALTIVGFLISQSLLGIIITSWSIYICVAVSPSLYAEKSEVTFVFTVTGMYGTHVLFHNLSGIKICQKCYMQAHKKSTRGLLFFWTLAGCNTLINLLILSMMAVKISKHIVRSLRHSLEKGMQNYLKDPYWKHTIDRLQVKMKCCGVNSYKDWYRITWIGEYHINLDAESVKELKTSKVGTHLPVTPWTCCEVDFPMQCFHDPLQQIESAYLWTEQPAVVLDSIYNDGCLVLLRRPIESALVGFILLTVLILLLQIVTVLMSRILYTSCRNAILLNDVEGIAPGWIFGRGDCGWTRGAGLEEIMEGYDIGGASSSTSKADQKSSKSSGKVNCNVRISPRISQMYHKAKKTCSSMSRSDEEPVSSCDEAALML